VTFQRRAKVEQKAVSSESPLIVPLPRLPPAVPTRLGENIHDFGR
jgi:hypothetical protein